MKKYVVVGLAILLFVSVIFFLFSSVMMRPARFPDNEALTAEENKMIKTLLLDAVKDRCSLLHKLDANEIYDADSAEFIIQYDEEAKASKGLLCLIDPNFMNTAVKTEDGGYQVIIKIFYPEDLYYCFEIHTINGKHLITSFLTDI